MAESSYRYLPWVRQGIAGAITQTDTDDARVELDVAVHLNQGDPVAMTVRLYGPGDVTGFDAREVVRTDPRHLSPDFEPNYFPLVEFDRPDFPWLFTPAAANEEHQLCPWICLVAVEKDANAKQIEINPLYPLPVLHVANAQQDLPDLNESWAWAHAEVAGAVSSEVEAILAANTERVISRLLCPRRLQPNTTYYACVVPTFEVGRKAGLGQPVAEDAKLDPAWNSTTGPLDLPVYYHWEFSTGAAGDFESLVWLLERQPLPQEVGARPLRVRSPGGGLPDIDEGLWLEGALRPEGSSGSPEPEDRERFEAQRAEFQTKLKTLLNELPLEDSQLAIPPPIYGRWHAARPTVSDDPAATPLWPHELNLDPRYRAIAALGTRVVQEQQEQLMAAAWEQVGEIERANQLLRQAQLARAAGIAIHRAHLSPMSAEALVALTAPVHTRVRAAEDAAATVAATVGESRLPAALSAPFRRITRARGPLARRLGVTGGYWTGRLVVRLNRDDDQRIRVTPEPRPPSGMVTMDRVFNDVSEPGRPEPATLCWDARPERVAAVTVPDTAPGAELLRAFKAAALAHQERYAGCRRSQPEERAPLGLEALRARLLARLDPNVTVEARWGKRVEAPRWKPDDALEPVMAAPEFPTPMYQPLAELSQDLLLPGLEHVPPNTVALLGSNPAFIEAYMVGLNHEMSRELLWREFPTDQRGTYFRSFWDPRSRVPAPATAVKDIPAIHEWTGGLGDHLGGGVGDQLVLLIRGDLLRRYPRAVIYAAQATWAPYTDDEGTVRYRRELAPLAVDANGYPTNEKYPILLGSLAPDITFLGFDLAPEVARGVESDAGWFIILQQPPTEPRYGLDASPATNDPAEWTWRDLSWKHVRTTMGTTIGAEYEPGGYITLTGGPASGFPTVSEPPDLAWDEHATSAQIAAIILQQPFRAAVHASDLLPEER
jgi:hypothetical protein